VQPIERCVSQWKHEKNQQSCDVAVAISQDLRRFTASATDPGRPDREIKL
jgi:hypothetical protein